MDKHAVQRIHLECETVQAHLDLAREAFGKYYTAHNTRAIFWLTIAVLVLTAVQVGVGLEPLSWYKTVVDNIERVAAIRRGG